MSGGTLGDAGAPNDDTSYTGGEGALSLDYARTKYREFQAAMVAGDAAYSAAVDAFNLFPTDELSTLISEYQSRVGEIRALAETLNAGASAINAAGGRMPILSLPQTLGLPALVVPAAVAIALAAASSTVAYLWGFSRGTAAAIAESKRIVSESDADDATKAQIVGELDAYQQRVQTSIGNLLSNPFANMGGVLKWALVAGGVFLAWKYWKGSRDGD